MKVFAINILFTLAIFNLSYAQQKDYTRIRMLYDPLFWKKPLKFSRNQCAVIQEINGDFYLECRESIADSSRHQLAVIVENRNKKIWDVFSQRQRTKWIQLQQLYR